MGDIVSDLRAHYPFVNNVSDISGNANHATANGAPSYIDILNGAGILLSTGQSVDFPFTINAGTDYAISFWIKIDTLGNMIEVFNTMREGSPYWASVYVDASGVIYSEYDDGEVVVSNYVNSTEALEANQLYHVVVTGSESFHHIYVNAVETVGESIGLAANSSGGGNGRAEYTGSEFTLAAMRIYERHLTAGDITDLYNLDLPEIGVPVIKSKVIRDFGGVEALLNLADATQNTSPVTRQQAVLKSVASTITGLQNFDVAGDNDDISIGSNIRASVSGSNIRFSYNLKREAGVWKYISTGYGSIELYDYSTGVTTVYFASSGTADDAVGSLTGLITIGADGKISAPFFKGAAGTTTLTSTSNSIAIDFASNNDFKHTLTENTTLANPSNVVEGQSGAIRFTQDSTPRLLAYDSYWKFPGGVIPDLTASAGAFDTLFYHVHSSTRIEASLQKGWA